MEHLQPNQNFGPLLQPAALGDLEASIAVKVLAAGGDVAMVLDRNGVICDLAVGNTDLQLDDFESWVNKPWLDTVTLECRPKVTEMLRDAAEDRAIRWRELNHPSRRGDSVPLRYVAVGAGEDGRIIAIGRDHRAASVLQQRLLQAQQSMERDYARMRQSESRYRMLFQSTSEAVLVVDGSTRRIGEANPAADRLIGGEGSLVGKPFAKLFSAQSQEDAASLLSVAQASASRSGPQSSLIVNGRMLHATASLFRQDRTMHFLVRLVPAEQLEPAVGDASQRMLKAINLLPDGFVVTDHELTILTQNVAFLDMVNLPSPEQANGTSLSRFLGRPGVDRNILLENLTKHGLVRNFPTVLQTQFGEVEDVEVCAVSVPEVESGFFGFSIRRVSRRDVERGQPTPELVRSPADMSELVGRVSLKEIVRDTTDFVERLCIEAALNLTGNNRASAAEILGVSRQSLYSKLHRFGIGNFDDDGQ
jgi:transcriptional regulator PpsR